MLSGRRILVVEDDEDSREMMAMLLESNGATVRSAGTGELALEIASTWAPDVMLIDLALPGIDGIETLRQTRAIGANARVPAIAISGHAADHDRTRSLSGGFEKHLAKPASVADIVAALAMLPLAGDADLGDMRRLLARVNQASGCRFTSVLRFGDGGTLVSVWTFDREGQNADPFPPHMFVDQSYCSLIRDTGTAQAIEDSRSDPRVRNHPKRDELAAYLGIPLFNLDTTMYGTLCSYDVSPQKFSPEAVDEHTRAAKQITTVVDSWRATDPA